MEASLGPVLTNVIMAKCEKVIVDNLVKEGTIKLYMFENETPHFLDLH